jgi:post-segregation antitoxin (ccd killing protein)
MSVTVSAKIPRGLRERLRESQVDVSSVVRTALEKEVAQLEEEKLKNKLESLKKELSRKISTKDIVRTIRSSREER